MTPREQLDYIIRSSRKLGGSDIHLIAGLPPSVRVAGEILMAKNHDPLDARTVTEMAHSLLTDMNRERLERERELCISYRDESGGRLRITFYHRLDTVEMSVRLCNVEVLGADRLMLPPVIDEFSTRTSGLLLVTGPTGAGKTTTMNYLVDRVNSSRRGKIITIEDPVEFEHPHKRCVVTQLEVGTDTLSFGSCLRSVLRLDPDVVVIGEMRDLETIATALVAAETGHLVLATLHTPSAVGTAERIVHAFPGEQQNQTAVQFASVLQAVVSQRLVPSVDKKSRVLATEVLIGNDAIRANIRDGNFHQLANAIYSGRSIGMHSLEASLVDLYQRGLITKANAYIHCNNRGTIDALLKHAEGD